MLQVDGSPHDWLQGRGSRLCLIAAIDDATSKVMGAFFAPAESSWGYFRLFCEIFKQHGVPQSIYTDCHSVFFTDREPTLEEQLINRKPTTEVGRGLEELGVTLILAHCPQAKGRIERLWNTFQDPLVSELRLAKAKTVEQATVVLNVISSFITVDSLSPLKQSRPGENSVRLKLKGLCVSNNSVAWPRTTP